MIHSECSTGLASGCRLVFSDTASVAAYVSSVTVSQSSGDCER
ncbi:hypothetical protein ACVIGA_003097 [Bradyrhizobium sp. USDA 3240]